MSVAGVLALQRAAGNVAVGAVLRRAALARDAGWTGVDPGSWNAGPREVKSGKGVKRVPVEGLKQGHRSPSTPTRPSSAARARRSSSRCGPTTRSSPPAPST
jgi:hypothetical protein